MIRQKSNSRHYNWGNHCEGWHLVETDSLSIIQEIMPVGRAETLHFHRAAQQFFFILTGNATFEVEGKSYALRAGEGIHILAKQKHRIINTGDIPLEFIVTSEPKSHGDRENIPESESSK